MQFRSLKAASTWLLLFCGGCCFGPTVDTVPWWKGIPSLLIEPASLEATVWRDHLRAKHSRGNQGVSPVYMTDVWWEDTITDESTYESIPVPPVAGEHLLPPPAEQ